MSNDDNPTADDERLGSDGTEDATVPSPRPDQRAIIESDEYPMRVLAGAGTGKTFTLVRKIERLIESGVSPDRILALTFTNKAADSMREKLVEQVGVKGHDIEAYTYHAVCHYLLQEYAYHADIEPRYDIASDADRFAIIFDILDEMPYRFTNPDVYDDLEYATGAPERLLGFIPVMKRAGITPDDLDNYLPDAERLLALGDAVERIEAAADDHVRVSWRSPDADRLADIRDGLGELTGVLEEVAEGLEETPMEEHVHEYIEVMITTTHSLSAFLEENESAIVRGQDGLGNAFKLPAFLFGTYSSPPSGIPDIDYTLTGKLEAFIEECQLLADLTHGYRAYERRLREEHLLDFNDLVLEATSLLEDDTVSNWVSGQYDYVFCDEFQDTDTSQFELVERLLDEDELFVVGDDDQAIYEWRGANIENIGSRLQTTFPELTDRTLEENFRSRQPILDLANNALAQHPQRTSDKELRAVGESDPRAATDGVVTITAAEELEDEAAQIRNAVTRLLTGDTTHAPADGYSPGDIAILVRKKRHAHPIIQALADAGIPYELGGDLASESPGVKTVIAALKAIANPEDEVSLNRVLRMRYRLSEEDLERLNTYSPPGDSAADAPLHQGLCEIPLGEFAEPARVEEAREHFTSLWNQRETESLLSLYQELKSLLRIEWFLSEQERRDLRAVDDLVSSFDDEAVQPELSSEFIEFLARHETIADTSTQTMEDQPETENAAVSIMTIHKSKGLEFPVVFLPQLQADEWEPGARTHDLAEAVLTGSSPLDQDFSQQDAHEARRLLHVGITRSEDLCIPVGRGEADDTEQTDDETSDDDGLSFDVVSGLLPDEVPWPVDGVTFPIWQTITTSLPPTATDGTDSLAAPVSVGARTAAIEDGRELTRQEAQDRVFELAETMLAGDFDLDAHTLTFTDEALGEPPQPTLVRKHSYTSLDTFTTCARRHYLDHVVRAFDDPAPGSTSDDAQEAGATAPGQRRVGILFHETAERAVTHGYDTREEWYEVAARIANARGEHAALESVRQCIDRFFASAVADWEFIAAEEPFEIDIAGETIVGQIDALCRRPDGDLVVLDFKATTTKRSLETDLQLPIYLLACEEFVDEAVRTAGYLYVGDIGPELAVRTYDETDRSSFRAQIAESVTAAAASAYESYTAGKHCQSCPHQSLPCSNEANIDQ